MDRAKMDWRRLDPEKVRAGVQIVARHLGVSVRSPRGLSEEEMAAALEPYRAFAEITLIGGAFDYPPTDSPTTVQLLEVMMDFMRALGELSASDEMTLRAEMIKILPPDMANALRKPS